jgi:hypothetical protein
MDKSRTWVLDTETKGTGAQMVPLEKADQPPEPKGGPMWVPPKKRERAPAPPPPRVPRRFRVVDVVTRAVLSDDAPLRATLEVLRGVERMNDVTIYVRDDTRWRLLSRNEQQLVWDRRPSG